MSAWIQKIFGASWRTTTIAVCALAMFSGKFLTAVGTFGKFYLDGDPTTIPVWGDVANSFGEMLAAFGLLFARDNKVSSDAAGAQ